MLWQGLPQAYLGGKEPEEEVAVVSLIHSEEAAVAHQVQSLERSHHAQSSPWWGNFTQGLEK